MKSRTTGKKPIRVAGLELGGGKSSRTAVVVLDFFRKESRIFISEIIPHIRAEQDRGSDEVLVAEIDRLNLKRIGVNAPLNLPPWFDRSRGRGRLRDALASRYAPIKWMREEADSAGIHSSKRPTPYTQRPIDVLLRTRIQARYEMDLFIEETLGSGRAPLAARMQFLMHALGKIDLIETNPRLALAGCGEWFGISSRELRRYRNLDEGAEYRLGILDQLDANLSRLGIPQLFLYEADKQTLAQELGAFNALLNGLMAAYSYGKILETPDRDFDRSWGFIAIPKAKEELTRR